MGWWVPVVTGALALLVGTSAVLPRSTWVRQVAFLVNAVATTAHEAGHALASIVTGGGVWVIRVKTPDSGVTRIWYSSQLSGVIISAAGYATPPLAGLAIAWQLSRGHAPQILTLTVAAMLLLRFLLRRHGWLPERRGWAASFAGAKLRLRTKRFLRAHSLVTRTG